MTEHSSMMLQLWPAWLAILLAGAAGLHTLITTSEKVANLFGRVGRWLHRRARKSYILDIQEFNLVVNKAIGEARDKWEAEESRALSVVEERLKYMTDLVDRQQLELRELGFRHLCTLSYIEYEAEWHHRLRMAIIDQNDPTALLPAVEQHISYAEFETKCRSRGTNWRQWSLKD